MSDEDETYDWIMRFVYYIPLSVIPTRRDLFSSDAWDKLPAHWTSSVEAVRTHTEEGRRVFASNHDEQYRMVRDAIEKDVKKLRMLRGLYAAGLVIYDSISPPVLNNPERPDPCFHIEVFVRMGQLRERARAAAAIMVRQAPSLAAEYCYVTEFRCKASEKFNTTMDPPTGYTYSTMQPSWELDPDLMPTSEADLDALDAQLDADAADEDD